MQMSSQKNHDKGFCLLVGTFFWYFEVEFAVLEWDSMFCSTDMRRFLNQFLVPALKRQHKNNSCTSIILPLCRLQQALKFLRSS